MSQLNNEQTVVAEEPLPIAEALRPRRFTRNALSEELPEGAIELFIDETYQFLNRRFQTLAVDFNDIAKTNFNPFLLLITAPVYNFVGLS
ncbi:hypothetical protein [Agrobacterium tumefaciens]|uniref:Uncharacterized protein n=1 Tax=Agrobacterium tumefaciens TaxID=358 RepID=A0A4D7Z7C4_AGRTU|nr:hypothetical protein [Agrobacterium tumefaciens]QCL97930.1 hypothetical protein CFBP7129_27575 [Agrobacterium tumefaciens]